MSFIQAGATLFVSSALLLSSALVRAEDLVDVYRLAQENDAVYQSAKYRYDSTLESRVQARAAFLPQLDASGSTGLNDFNDDRNETFNSTTLSLSLNQSLFNRRNQIRARQADLGIAEAQASLTASEQDLLLRSAQAYFGVLSASDNLQFAQSEKKAIEQQLEQAERRFEVGLIAVT
ncbi:MAG TPA: type I secretion protein TolC, partial [Gammaproteobacteria bacterium]|nr:type I secretion protein TolC [Gammaproteobacteria bacterium]